MPSITIIKPNNTPEQEKKVLRNIADAMEKIIETEYRTKVKIDLKIREER